MFTSGWVVKAEAAPTLLERTSYLNLELPYKKHDFPETAMLVRSCIDTMIDNPAGQLIGSHPHKRAILDAQANFSFNQCLTTNSGETYHGPNELFRNP